MGKGPLGGMCACMSQEGAVHAVRTDQRRGRSGSLVTAWEWRLVTLANLSPPPARCSKSLLTLLSSRRYLQADIEAFDIRELTPKFDVILLEPPLEEYYRETGITANEKCWTWDDVR